MLTSRLLFASAVSASLLATATCQSRPPSLRFVFDPDYSGVSGYIAFHYSGHEQSGANVEASLDFNALNMAEIKALDANCKGDKITEFTWHVHTQWKEPSHGVSSSTKLAECAKAITGNHYDPYKICGPASEYAETPACAPKIKEYKCTPDEYHKNFAACEAGDLSGKFGNFKPDGEGRIVWGVYDPRFPFASEATDNWNIVIHAVCGKATPRIACAQGHVDQTTGGDSLPDFGEPAKLHVKEDASGDTVVSLGKQLRVRVHTHHEN